ncbi:glycosyltransferase family 4 protein [Peribacillus tepidiphilus]|uniref:glycosyltransferase family 4 protein n=1 Tax=Peribacillus tepidiphilus TaxID=2652445 RepID=UPI0035B513E8
MKVCHLTSVHPPEDIRIFVKECVSLYKGGHDVSLIVRNSETYEKDGVKIIGVTANASNRFIRMVKGPMAVYKKALEVDADVYHFHDPELIPVGLLLKRKGKKVVYDVHEDVPEQVLSKQWIPGPLRKFVSNVVKQVERFASKRYDAVVTATPTINDRFKTYTPNSVIVHNFPIMSELMGNTENELNASLENGQNSKEPYVIYVGGLTKIRGVLEMVDAISELNAVHNPRTKLYLAGAFAPAELQREVEKKQGWNDTEYLGFLNRSQVKKYLSQAKLGLVLLHPEPRYMVSYPIKMFEYMAAGIPVVAANFPLWKSIVEGAQCGLTADPMNPKEIAEAMKWILTHPEEAIEMGKNGQKAIVEKYNWEKESETLLQLYDRLAN